jgi:UDP-GlcNAc:undecaprenyl-phosphate GlcNAc-1-phosphate transferase
VSGWWEAFQLLSILVACLGGFLYFNMRHPWRRKASIFLGDAGSMALGLTIAWFAINLSQGPGPGPVFEPVTIAWIIALPIIDAFGLLVMRLKEKRAPFSPDRRHFHHHFLEAGFTPAQATILILAWGVFLGAVGVVGMMLGVPGPVLGWLWIVLWLSHALLVIKSASFVQFLKRMKSLRACG